MRVQTRSSPEGTGRVVAAHFQFHVVPPNGGQQAQQLLLHSLSSSLVAVPTNA